MSISKAFIVGNLTKEPVRRVTQSGKKVASFSVATNTGFGEHKTVSFWNCVAWEKRGEIIFEHGKKGSKISITGTIAQRSYEGKTGKVVTTEITVDEFEFMNKTDRKMDSADTSVSDPRSFSNLDIAF